MSIAFLNKHGFFCGYHAGSIIWRNSDGEETRSIGVAVSIMHGDNYIRFRYTTADRNNGEETKYDYKVQLTTTNRNFDGVRYWFICPLSKNGVYCGRKVAKLYKAPGADHFGCRHCYNLSYESRNEPRLARPGGIAFPLVLERRIEELRRTIRRWKYRGRPTKKAKKLHALEQRMDYGFSIDDLLLK